MAGKWIELLFCSTIKREVNHRDDMVRALRTVQDVVKWTALYAASYIFPERTWPWLCRLLARLELAVNRKRTRARTAVFTRVLDAGSAGVAPEQVELHKAASHYREQIQTAACYRIQGWNPRLTLVGQSHLEGALASGRGAILWEANFIYSGLVTKMALARPGYPVAQLSFPDHGLALSGFGERVINPLVRRAEERHLAERIVLKPEDGHQQYLRLMARLRQNQVVCIRVLPRARQLAPVPFLDGHIELPLGPAVLARLSGAPLLRGVTVCTGAGAFETRIEPVCEESGDAGDLRVVERLARLLEADVRMYPYLWLGWSFLKPNRPPQAPALESAASG